MRDTPSEILLLVRTLAAATSRSESTVSRLASGSGMTTARLAEGKTITVQRADRILQWLSDHWPRDLAWPPRIARPAPTPGSSAAKPDKHVLAEARILAELAAAMRLGPDGEVESDSALRAALGVSRGAWQHALRYRDEGPMAGRIPTGGWTGRCVEALVAAGDGRFASRVSQRRIDVALAQEAIRAVDAHAEWQPRTRFERAAAVSAQLDRTPDILEQAQAAALEILEAA